VSAVRAPGEVDPRELDAYHRDGAAVVRGVVPSDWIERMRAAIDDVLQAPSPLGYEYTAAGAPGRYYGDFFLWRERAEFRAFMAESPLPELAARVMSSRRVRFFYDQLLVKEPGTAEETPWHHDLPYWPLRGEQILSIWVPFDAVSRETGAVTYIRGSHRWGKLFAPAAFSGDSGFASVYEKAGLEPLPDIASQIDCYELLCWDLEPGDVLLHHPLTLHHASGNASADRRRRGLALRYIGDDAVFDARPGTFLESPRIRDSIPPLALRDGDAIRGALFPEVWPRAHRRLGERDV
jgi:ectoine hydroxylase-related dioxygenase (phytanoyl-CoA dioxygenase family)